MEKSEVEELFRKMGQDVITRIRDENILVEELKMSGDKPFTVEGKYRTVSENGDEVSKPQEVEVSLDG